MLIPDGREVHRRKCTGRAISAMSERPASLKMTPSSLNLTPKESQFETHKRYGIEDVLNKEKRGVASLGLPTTKIGDGNESTCSQFGSFPTSVIFRGRLNI